MPQMGSRAEDGRQVLAAVELRQAAAPVALLQQPQQLRHPAGLRLRTRLLDRGQCDTLVRSGEAL